MSHILVISQSEYLRSISTRAFVNGQYPVKIVESINLAKSSMLTEMPAVILCDTSLEGDEFGGNNFCKQIQNHSALSVIPVALFLENFNEEVLESAKETGAKMLFQAPVELEHLSTHVNALITGKLGSLEPSSSKSDSVVNEVESGGPILHGFSGELAEQIPDLEESFVGKLEIAKELLAKVLHNLKTSHLLQVVEKEDVPRIVLEITRSVCTVEDSEEEP